MRSRTSGAALVLGTALGTVLALAPAVPATATPPYPGGACTPGTRLLGFSDDLDKTSYAGTPVAGLSALATAGPGRLLALVDNVATTPARFYDLRVRPGSAAVTGVTVLRRPDGTPYTGADFDGEGLVLERRGRTVLASSEAEPSVRRFDRRSGRQLAELPVPDAFRVGSGAPANQTFEALTADGRDLYAGMEGPLAADGPGLLRILKYTRDRVAAQYAYRADPGLGLVELAAVGDGTLLALERGFTAGVGNTVRVHRVPLTGAADVSALPTLVGAPADTFLGKRLLLDLADCPPSGATAKQPQPNPLLDNVEGMALSRDRQVLTLVSDDNSNPVQTTRLHTVGVSLPAEPTLLGRALLPATDPRGVSTPARPGEYGVGPAFRFPPVSVESVYPLGGGRVLVANDNNFPNDDGRIPGRPDDTEVIVLDVPGLRS